MLWRAEDFDQTIASAKAEALGYAAEQPDMTFAGLVQAYRLFDEPRHGAEVFSLVRESGLEAQNLPDFDTGKERQGDTSSDA
ncbi:hypothetical protein AAH979_17640 [Plantactinospora sp. ZYX-F-223]|uniref:hypothetical protein n=1 Tax=Plantactinospora sp. ZYX-F-223 TaxID=3144103 RepID=UPI0031FC58CB